MCMVVSQLLGSRAVDKTKFQILCTQIILTVGEILRVPKICELTLQQIEAWRTKQQSVGAFKKQVAFGMSLIKAMA